MCYICNFLRVEEVFEENKVITLNIPFIYNLTGNLVDYKMYFNLWPFSLFIIFFGTLSKTYFKLKYM